jgi:DNA-binding transcriptional LysR family regulator
MDRWIEIELFVRVAELGSLSRAAAPLGLSNAAASRHLAALEARLALRLAQRNTRRLFLTDVGDAFCRRCKPLPVNDNLANHPNELRFTRDGIESALAVQGVLEANDGQIVRAAALKHLGILMQPM